MCPTKWNDVHKFPFGKATISKARVNESGFSVFQRLFKFFLVCDVIVWLEPSQQGIQVVALRHREREKRATSVSTETGGADGGEKYSSQENCNTNGCSTQLTNRPHVDLLIQWPRGILLGCTPHATSYSRDVGTIFLVLFVEQHNFCTIEVIKFDVAIFGPKELCQLDAIVYARTDGTKKRKIVSVRKQPSPAQSQQTTTTYSL